MNYRQGGGAGRFKPPPGSPINWGHPLARGLVARVAMLENFHKVTGSGAVEGRTYDAVRPVYWGMIGSGMTKINSIFNGGRALSFTSGRAQRYTIGDIDAPMPVTAAPLTIVAWLNVSSLTNRQYAVFLSQRTLDTEYFGIYISETTGAFACVSRTAANLAEASGGAASLNTWYQVAGVFRSSSSREIFVNGVSIATDTGTAVPSGLVNVCIGSLQRLSQLFADALKVDNVSIYNRALSAQEIRALYNEPFADFTPTAQAFLVPGLSASSSYFLAMH